MRGIAGQRQNYQPNTSILTNSCDPSVVVRTFQKQFGLTDFYLADLDSIQTNDLNRCTIAELSGMPGKMFADCGLRSAKDVEEVLSLGVDKAILALETLPDIHTAKQLVRQFGADSLVFSLDLHDGTPITTSAEWLRVAPLTICQQLIDCGFTQFIVLDLAAVGTAKGTPTLQLCRELRAVIPKGRIISGGGIRGVDDIMAAQEAGIDAVLVASALHDGSLTAENVRDVTTPQASTRNGNSS